MECNLSDVGKRRAIAICSTLIQKTWDSFPMSSFTTWVYHPCSPFSSRRLTNSWASSAEEYPLAS